MEINDIIKNYCKEMHEYKNPQEIESMKKVMKKNVKIFERNSLLAFMLLKTCGNKGFSVQSLNKKDNKQCNKFQKKDTAVSNLDCVQLWTNVFFFNNEKQKEFVDFVVSTSRISASNIKSIKRMKHYSFINVDPESSEKILQAFSSPIMFEKLKVTIRPAKGRANEEN